jgi:hypothetical protein
MLGQAVTTADGRSSTLNNSTAELLAIDIVVRM